MYTPYEVRQGTWLSRKGELTISKSQAFLKDFNIPTIVGTDCTGSSKVATHKKGRWSNTKLKESAKPSRNVLSGKPELTISKSQAFLKDFNIPTIVGTDCTGSSKVATHKKGRWSNTKLKESAKPSRNVLSGKPELSIINRAFFLRPLMFY